MTERSWASAGLEVLGPADFDGDRLRRQGRYVVTFGATWCSPTRHFVPKFKEWSKEVDAIPAIADITELESPLWDVFRIKITPTVVCFLDGSAAFRSDGRRWIGIRARDLRSVAEFLGSTPRPPVPP